MTDRKSLFDKIEASPPQRQARAETVVDGLSPGESRENSGDDFWADLEALLGRPLVLINAIDLYNGDFAKAYTRPPRGKRGH
jgi:hypothetical protein